ncbi:unknown [Firmicutes bacterium CAG:137]|nr:unknown [Firmicutes bacterium CAG:137]
MAFFPKPAAFLFGKNCAILNLHSNSCNSESTILYVKCPVSSWRNLLTAVPSSQAAAYPPKNLQLVPSMPIFRGAAGHFPAKLFGKGEKHDETQTHPHAPCLHAVGPGFVCGPDRPRQCHRREQQRRRASRHAGGQPRGFRQCVTKAVRGGHRNTTRKHR